MASQKLFFSAYPGGDQLCQFLHLNFFSFFPILPELLYSCIRYGVVEVIIIIAGFINTQMSGKFLLFAMFFYIDYGFPLFDPQESGKSYLVPEESHSFERPTRIK